jgi:hypothetical protein
MIFHFRIYHSGVLNGVASEWAGTESARAEAFRLLEHSTGPVANDIARNGQTRVVVSDDDGMDLFTLTYVAAEPSAQLAAA